MYKKFNVICYYILFHSHLRQWPDSVGMRVVAALLYNSLNCGQTDRLLIYLADTGLSQIHHYRQKLLPRPQSTKHPLN